MKADIIVKGNSVFTGLKDSPEKLVIAIKKNKIIGVDSVDKITHYQNETTKVIDAGSKLVIPGFHDAHIHLLGGALFNEYSVPLSEASSLENMQEKLKEYAENYPNKEWIIGTGWDHTAWGETEFPTRRNIDEVINDRPVFLLHAEGHYAWVNTIALEICGITSETLDPDYGIIYKDETGNPTGILIESAISLAGKYAYDFSHYQKREMVEYFMNHAASLGVTSVSDVYMSRAHEALEAYDVYEEFDKNGKLKVRIHVYPSLNGDLESVNDMRKKNLSDKYQVSGLKQFIDGVVTGYTALMLEPYKDKQDTKGELSFPKEQLQKWVTEADDAGYQIRFHTIGDGAVRLGLDLFEQAQKENGVRDSRHSLEHIEIVAPTDIPRFKELGVIASVQPAHIALMPKESHTERVGEEKFPYIYPNKTLAEAGATVPNSSDYPIISLNPLIGIYHAITRKDFSLKDTWNEQEKVSLAEALKAYTKLGAYSVFREHEMGTLETGKLADLVILDTNLFEVHPDEILKAKVEMTIMDGEIVFEESKISS